MKIYTGKSAVFGIQLVIDQVWRYVMTATDLLTVKIADSYGNVISTELTNEAVDDKDKMVLKKSQNICLFPENLAQKK